MSNAHTGGPAFPLSEDILRHPDPRHVMGMTLRDYFAAKCCAAMISSIQDDFGYSRIAQIAHAHEGKSVSQWFASEAYKQADAMLRERAK